MPFSVHVRFFLAPGDAHLTLHIKDAGDWTGRLHELANKDAAAEKGQEHGATPGVEVMDVMGPMGAPAQARTIVRGLFACTRPSSGNPPTAARIVELPLSCVCSSSLRVLHVQDYAEFSRLLLVSAGIGITPTVSVLRDVLHRVEEQHAGGTPGRATLEQLAVHWVIREQLSVAWFVEQCLGDVLAVDAAGILTATVHLTGK